MQYAMILKYSNLHSATFFIKKIYIYYWWFKYVYSILICLTGAVYLFDVDLQWPGDEHHEFWMFCATGRTEEEMGRTRAHITSLLPSVFHGSISSQNYMIY